MLMLLYTFTLTAALATDGVGFDDLAEELTFGTRAARDDPVAPPARSALEELEAEAEASLPTGEASLPTGEAEALMIALDSDHDGAVSLAELREGLEHGVITAEDLQEAEELAAKAAQAESTIDTESNVLDNDTTDTLDDRDAALIETGLGCPSFDEWIQTYRANDPNAARFDDNQLRPKYAKEQAACIRLEKQNAKAQKAALEAAQKEAQERAEELERIKEAEEKAKEADEKAKLAAEKAALQEQEQKQFEETMAMADATLANLKKQRKEFEKFGRRVDSALSTAQLLTALKENLDAQDRIRDMAESLH